MSTVRDLINGSLRLLGAIASGETCTAEEQSEALTVLNDMLDSWSTENLVIYGKATETFPLVSGTQAYTIGPAGTFNTVRPLKLEFATIQDTTQLPSIEFPLEILNLDQWAAIQLKTTPTTRPMRLYLDDSYPLSTINLWPVPGGNKNIVLYSIKPLTAFATVNITISLPPGYMKALKYNLAMELAPEYGKEPSLVVATGALESKANVKRANIKPHYLGTDSGVLSPRKSFNWLMGQ